MESLGADRTDKWVQWIDNHMKPFVSRGHFEACRCDEAWPANVSRYQGAE